MLRVTVELVPHGDETNKKKIGELVIANDPSKSTGGISAYQAWRSADDYTGDPVKFAKLAAFDRSQGVWELIRLITEALALEKHTPDKGKFSLSTRLKKRLLG